MARKAAAEKALRAKVAASPRTHNEYGPAWDKIARSQKVSAEIAMAQRFLERGIAFESQLFTIARHLVRLAEEKDKPNSTRLKEYRDSALESLRLDLFSDAPIYPEFEKAKLAHSLAFWRENVGKNDPVVELVLRGR